jgi:hypothetical protein
MALVAGACNGEIYVRDGVTDGDTFFLAERALLDPDPVLQSWVSYSLTRSACQLQSGSDNPSRSTSFECELTAREHLLESWSERRARSPSADRYLDLLLFVQQAGHLDEYVWWYFHERSWRLPAHLETGRFDEWRQRHLGRHEPQTRLIGSWGYARPAAAPGEDNAPPDR